MYGVLGPKGPYQSICGGKTDCVVDLIERSLATSDSVYNGPEFEGTKFKSNGAMGFANEEYPDIKGGYIAQTTTRSSSGIDRHCLDCQHRWRNK